MRQSSRQRLEQALALGRLHPRRGRPPRSCSTSCLRDHLGQRPCGARAVDGGGRIVAGSARRHAGSGGTGGWRRACGAAELRARPCASRLARWARMSSGPAVLEVAAAVLRHRLRGRGGRRPACWRRHRARPPSSRGSARSGAGSARSLGTQLLARAAVSRFPSAPAGNWPAPRRRHRSPRRDTAKPAET